MPSVDDVLRQAFEPTDESWVRLAPAACAEVVTRHRRHQVVRRSVVGALAAAVLAVGVAVVDGDPGPRTVQPAEPPPTPTATVVTAPLEGTWISSGLDETDVSAAATAAGVPDAVDAMLEQLPEPPFKVVMVVRGSSLSTSVRPRDGQDVLMDQETLSTTGRRLEVRPFDVPVATFHRWVLESAVLTMSFESTTEGVKNGVPGEAWQRLLYDSAPLARQAP